MNVSGKSFLTVTEGSFPGGEGDGLLSPGISGLLSIPGIPGIPGGPIGPPSLDIPLKTAAFDHYLKFKFSKKSVNR